MATLVTDIPQLKFNKMSKEKYEELLTNGELVENEFYITPENEEDIDIPENVVEADNYINAKLWKGTLEEYEALESYDDSITYIITDDVVEGSTVVSIDAYTKDETNELLNAKQETLVSGTNIKTINGESVLGEGDLVIDTLPIQENNGGKYLTTNGSETSWSNPTEQVESDIVAINEEIVNVNNELNNTKTSMSLLTDKSLILEQIHNRIFDGRDLTQVFAEEIANYSDEWVWIKDRIDNANYDGLYVGDYIPVTISSGTVGGDTINSQTFQCQIVGIDTYTGAGDVEIGHHIDFISREVIDTAMTWNPTDNNNGTSVQANPWLASKAYAWLNGVNNYTTSAYNNVAHGADCSSGGILQLLPTKLSDLIITKRQLLDSRYDSTKLLTYSTTWAWGDMGKLWLPNELEAYGFQVRSNMGYAQGYWNPEANIGVSYPLYTNSARNRIKRTSTGGRSTWWLSSAAAHTSARVCYCGGDGRAHGYTATYSGIRCPLCFRIA